MSIVNTLLPLMAGGETTVVDDVFSVWEYDGTGATQNIENGIDLTNGGMVWTKARQDTLNSAYAESTIYDTERGVQKEIITSSDANESTKTGGITAFNSNGYTIGTEITINDTTDTPPKSTEEKSGEYVSWTFKKHKKFFDVIKYTGDGISFRSIAHNLDSVPGCIFIKRLDGVGGSQLGDWIVYHRGIDDLAGSANTYNDPHDYYLSLNERLAADNQYATNNGFKAAPDSSYFYINNWDEVNRFGTEYVAYVFAHNDGDGDFGPNKDQDIIKCGGYTINGINVNTPYDLEIDLGFEPDFLLFKRVDSLSNFETLDSTYDWIVLDSLRTMSPSNLQPMTRINGTDGELLQDPILLTSRGFRIRQNGRLANYASTNSADYVYIAVRRSMKTANNVDEVFKVTRPNEPYSNQPTIRTPFKVDMVIETTAASSAFPNIFLNSRKTTNFDTRISGTSTYGNKTQAYQDFDFVDGYADIASGLSTSNDYTFYLWKRAPKFYDHVNWYINSTASSYTIEHDLQAVPEMIIMHEVSDYTSTPTNDQNFYVYHKGLFTNPEQNYLLLNSNAALQQSINAWNDTPPTATSFQVGSFGGSGTEKTYYAHLFSTLPGVSKVGSYVGNGVNLAIDCGFSNGASFVMIRRAHGTSTNNWLLIDNVNGYNTSSDTVRYFNDAGSDRTDNILEYYSGGFRVTLATGGMDDHNLNGATYIYYAIAA